MTRPRSPTRPRATASCCARSAGSTRPRQSPLWMRVRLSRAGMRPVSLAVDITNYLMLELGQPLHAFDPAKLTGEIVVRRAGRASGWRRSTTSCATLDPEDILITDAVGADLDGRHHGRPGHRDLRRLDRHRDRGRALLARPASPAVPPAQAGQRGVQAVRARRRPGAAAARLVAGRAAAGRAGRRHVAAGRDARRGRRSSRSASPSRRATPGEVAGIAYGRETVVRRLEQVGCTCRRRRAAVRSGGVDPTGVVRRRAGRQAGRHRRGHADGHPAVVAARPDRPERPGRGGHPARGLREPALGAARRPRPGAGLTEAPAAAPPGRPGAGRRRLRRGRSPTRSSASATSTTCSCPPTTRAAAPCGWPTRSPRTSRCCVPRCCRACSGPWSATSGRGFGDVALFETGLVFRPATDAPAAAPVLGVDRRPTADELASLEAALPDQPLRVAVVLAGEFEPAGWWGRGPRRPTGRTPSRRPARWPARPGSS